MVRSGWFHAMCDDQSSRDRAIDPTVTRSAALRPQRTGRTLCVLYEPILGVEHQEHLWRIVCEHLWRSNSSGVG